MIILTESELTEAFQCVYMEYHDTGPQDEEEMIEMHALQERLIDKAKDMCLKYPHAEWRLHK